MAVKFELNKEKDQLVPYQALSEFADGLRKKLLNTSTFEKLFTSEKNREEKKKRITKLADNITGFAKKEGRYWFVDVFIAGAGEGGKADNLCQEVFKDLSKGDAFKELEAATAKYNEDFKAKSLAVANAAKELTAAVADKMSPVAAKFGAEYNELLKTPQQQPAAPAAPAAQAATPAAPAAQAAESIDRELYQSKKLLELGFITENEYLAKLIQAKNILEAKKTKKTKKTKTKPAPAPAPAPAAQTAAEAQPTATAQAAAPAPAGAPAQTAAEAQPAAQPAAAGAPVQQQPPSEIASAISTLVGQTDGDKNGELYKLTAVSGATQQSCTDMAKGLVTESLTAKQQQLVKLQVKKQVLTEYLKTGETTTKTQLNEFFLAALILAALAGVIAWAASKVLPMFKDAVNGSTPSGSSGKSDPVKTTQDLVLALGGGYNSQGQLVDIKGTAVPERAAQVQAFITQLNTQSTTITKAATDIITKGGGDPRVKALPDYGPFQQTFSVSPAAEVLKVVQALEAFKAV